MIWVYSLAGLGGQTHGQQADEGSRVTTSRIAETLRAARERAGLSREALAYHSGVSWSAIAQIESGRRRDVRLGSLAALAHALAVSVDYLIGNSPADTPPLLWHSLLAYGSDDEFQAANTPFLTQAIERSEPVLVVTTPSHIQLLRDSLDGNIGGVEFVDSVTFLTSPSDALNRYRTYAQRKFEAGAIWIRILGEPLWAGRSDAEVIAWTRFETLFNLAFAAMPMTVVCPYDTKALSEDVVANAHRTHPLVAHGTETVENPEYQAAENFLLVG
jgi:transcriptional regulator with XRE-family HTH domain